MDWFLYERDLYHERVKGIVTSSKGAFSIFPEGQIARLQIILNSNFQNFQTNSTVIIVITEDSLNSLYYNFGEKKKKIAKVCLVKMAGNNVEFIKVSRIT